VSLEEAGRPNEGLMQIDEAVRQIEATQESLDWGRHASGSG
jgi:hypothetical protein